MLHVTTEIGKAGKRERERRHYPGLDNGNSMPEYQPRGRRYIPHGYGDDTDWRPHPININPHYTENGPDWRSRPRRIPSPHNPDYRPEIWPDPWYSMRCYPFLQAGTTRSQNEWTLYPERKGYDATLRCEFNGRHKATATSNDEITHKMLYGRGRNVEVINKRNGIPQAAPGDKSYQTVEYENDFHKVGSTLPVVQFGGNASTRADTFVPLQELPPVTRPNYTILERQRKAESERDEVRNLERWRPATPLVQPGPAAILEDRATSQMSRY